MPTPESITESTIFLREGSALYMSSIILCYCSEKRGEAESISEPSSEASSEDSLKKGF